MKSIILTAVVTLITSSLIYSGSINSFNDDKNTGQDTTTYIFEGDTAPVFNVSTIDGREIDIDKLKGKIILINFFATWCPPCLREMPQIETEIYKKIKDDNFVLICIGREHTAEELIKFKEEKGFDLPLAPDPERKIYSKYAKMMIPRNFVIGRDGKVIYQHIGFETDEFERMVKTIKEELNKKTGRG
jgi:peroxiredoxin